MRAIVISDTHKHVDLLRRIIEKHRKEADIFLFLGDGEGDVEDVKLLYPDVNLVGVKGNCDIGRDFPDEERITVGEGRILMFHGHHQNVKNPEGRKERLSSLAREKDCNIVLYGHSHIGDTSYFDGVYIMNPGSPASPKDGKPSYGIIDISEKGILPFLVPCP